MLRSLRLHRLLTAFIAAFAFWVSSVEVVLPELHDGDAGAAATTLVQETTEAQSAAVVHAEASGSHHSVPGTDGALSHHGLHVDHCGHGHGATAGRASAGRLPTRQYSVPLATVIELASVDLPRHQRPPIA